MTQLRVMHIGTEKGWRGGENQLLNLARGLSDRGHVSVIVTPPGSELAARANEEGLDVATIGMLGSWDPIARGRIRLLARRRHVDIIHAHTSHAHSLGLAAAGTPERRPILIVSRRVDFPVGQNAASRRKYLSPEANYIAISTGVQNALLEGGVPEERIRIVHSGVRPDKFTYDRPGRQFRLEMGCGPNDLLIGNVAALSDHKGQRYLIEAAPRVLKAAPNARFCIVGEGELRADLERRIAGLGLEDRFRLAGYRQDIEGSLSGFDVFALSSHLEGLCTSIIDAMLLGIPVVATDVGGVPDLVIDEETGLLAPPRDAEALAEAIVKMLADERLRTRLSRRALDHVREGFTTDRMVEGTEAAYRAVLENRGLEGGTEADD